MSSREFCNQKGNECALVLPSVGVRDSLGTLAVQTLAAKENLANMDYCEILSRLYDIVEDLHRAYEEESVRSMQL